jgi:hypothetical protein
MTVTDLNRKLISILYDLIIGSKIAKTNFVQLIIFGIMAVTSPLSLFGLTDSLTVTDRNGGKQTLADTVPPFIPTFVPEEDGSAHGEVIDMPDDDAIRSNLGNIRINVDQNYEFNYEKYQVGVDRKTTWTIKVKDKFMDAVGSVSFSDFAGNSITQTFHYSAPKFRLSPREYAFGEVVTGSRPYTEFTITNDSYDRFFVLDKLNLKNGDEGFEIVLVKNTPGYLSALPKMFGPRDSLRFRVYFNPKKEGVYFDSIGIGTNYAFAYVSQVSAKVASPVIVANDLDFFDVTVGDTVRKTVSVQNKGLVDLYLNAYLSTKLPFWTTLPQITEKEPYHLPPGGRLNFDIFFAPDSLKFYKDSVIFFSNATGIDNVTYIYGHGVEPGLIVSSYNWGRRRIDRPDRPELRPVAPYTSPEFAVWITNTAQDTITIYNVSKVDTIREKAFEYVPGEFENLVLAPRQSKYVEVAFHPTEVGPYQMTLVYNNSYGSDSKSTFKGIGVAPRLKTNNVNFDTSLVNDVFTPASRKVVFYNENWEYADMVFIDSLKTGPNGGEISVDTSSKPVPWGSEGFKIFNINKRTSPWLIDKGDSLVLDINFVAQREGPATATIRTVSDALFDTTSTLYGTGIFRGIKVYTTPAVSCVSDRDTFNFHIENFGWDNIHIDSLRFLDRTSFSLVDTNFYNGFDILAQEKKVIGLIYTPDKVEEITNYIFAYHSYSNMVKEEKALISAKSYFTNKTISMHILNRDSLLDIGEVLKVKVFIDQGEDISFYRLKDFDVRVEYNPNFLSINKEDIYPGEIIKSGFFKPEKEKININSEKGIITFPINAHSNGYLNGDGEFLYFEFKVAPPKVPDSIYKSEIEVFISPSNNHCVDFTKSNDLFVTLNSRLSDNLEWIDFKGDKNQIMEVYPNPANSVNPQVIFEIKEEGFYELELYNSVGELLTKVFSVRLRPGNYRATIPVLQYPSGYYSLMLRNSDLNLVKDFIFIR